jgi:hypothetical protein
MEQGAAPARVADVATHPGGPGGRPDGIMTVLLFHRLDWDWPKAGNTRGSLVPGSPPWGL